MKKVVTITLDEDVFTKAKAALDYNFSKLINNLLKEWLEKNGTKIEGERASP